jgi:hypothetical protein
MMRTHKDAKATAKKKTSTIESSHEDSTDVLGKRSHPESSVDNFDSDDLSNPNDSHHDGNDRRERR